MFSAFSAAVAAARRDGGLYFAALLPEERILEAFGPARAVWQGWVYTPATTIWVFLSQCLSMDHSCSDAVAALLAWRLSAGLAPCSPRTGAYCTARGQLPEHACRELVRQTGCELEQQAPSHWLWKGRHVRVIDGSTITMADTPKNQAAYPQLTSQNAGCGFPIARIVVVFSLSVGAVLEAAIGKYEGKLTGENSMFRTLHDMLEEDDVVLADRYFSGWFDLILVAERGVDMVVRKHQLRATDFRRGTRLGRDDHLVCWTKPPRPSWMSPEQYAELPDELVLREVRVRVTQPGFRCREILVVTTLCDADEYTAAEIADLYRQRWQAELYLRSLKTVLQMDQLRCKSPERVRNEFYVHLLAYNLIRKAMAVAAFQTSRYPWQISFKAALQTLDKFLPILCSRVTLETWCEVLVSAVASHEVGHRPDRYEPRRKKRRPPKYYYLREPRENYRRRMAQGC